MKVGQWAVAVPKNRGEETRRRLINEGLLDTCLKPYVEGDLIWFPVTGGGDGSLPKVEFDTLPGRLVSLPRHELIGGIAIMQECDPEGAETLRSARPGIHTVLTAASDVQGEYRTREFRVLAGVPTTETTVLEYGHRFRIDLSTAYFSPRLATERQRVLSYVRHGETVLDMFAGVGPFAVAIATRASIVVAADINPAAVLLMKENCVKNGIQNVLPVLADSRRLPLLFRREFDRIVMNLPLFASQFLREAFMLSREGGTIHLYALESRMGEFCDEIMKYPAREVSEHRVRSYSPGKWHTVYDIVVGKKQGS